MIINQSINQSIKQNHDDDDYEDDDDTKSKYSFTPFSLISARRLSKKFRFWIVFFLLLQLSKKTTT